MNLEIRPDCEGADRRRIQTLADEAEAFARTLDLERSPSAHINRALRGIPEGRERDHLFGQILAELKRRKFMTPQERQRENCRILREVRDQISLDDAYKHEARMDPHEREDDEAA